MRAEPAWASSPIAAPLLAAGGSREGVRAGPLVLGGAAPKLHLPHRGGRKADPHPGGPGAAAGGSSGGVAENMSPADPDSMPRLPTARFARREFLLGLAALPVAAALGG